MTQRCIIKVEPSGRVKITEAPRKQQVSLEKLQHMVGGYIETVHTRLGDDIIMVVDEEGKNKGKEYNYLATSIYRGGELDPIVGSGVILQQVVDQMLGVESGRVEEILNQIADLSDCDKRTLINLKYTRFNRRTSESDAVAVLDADHDKPVNYIFRVGYALEKNIVEQMLSTPKNVASDELKNRYLIVDANNCEAGAVQTSKLFDTLEEAKNWLADHYANRNEKEATS